MGGLFAILIFAAILFAIGKWARPGTASEPEPSGLERRVAALEREVTWLRKRLAHGAAVSPLPEEAEPASDLEEGAADEPVGEPPPFLPIPGQPAMPLSPAAWAAPAEADAPLPAMREERQPPRWTPPPVERTPREPEPPPGPAIDWESFMGVKLFAWLGGFALFLCAAFFVKYSIEHDLISPLMRVLISFLVGAGVIVGGLALRPRGYAVTVQALCAAGVTVLYADIFAARSFYQFVSAPVAFGLMSLVTAVAVLLAVRLDARYVSVLGVVGGFLTPVLLSTGEDHPVGLFGYILLLDVGLLAVALKKRWDFIVPLAAAGTVAMEIGWTTKFFTPEKAVTGVVAWLLFGLLFLAVAPVAARLGARTQLLDGSAAFPALAGMGFAAFMIGVHHLGDRPGLVLGFLTLLFAGASVLSLLEPGFEQVHVAASSLCFAVLLQWTIVSLTPDLLPWGLAFYLAFAVLAAVFPLLLPRVRPDAERASWTGYLPLLGLALFVVPVARQITGFVLWPFLLLADAAVLAAAWFTGAPVAALLAVVLSFLPMAAWLGTAHEPVALAPFLGVLAFFALALFAASLLRLRREEGAAPGKAALLAGSGIDPDLLRLAEPPTLAALMPFLLLIGALLQARPGDPSPIYGLALLLTFLLLALVRLRSAEALAPVALLATGALMYASVMEGYAARTPWPLAVWSLLFVGIHLAFPFVFRGAFVGRVVPWATAALAGPALFFPVYKAVVELSGKELIGLLPAALALPYLAAVVALVRAPGEGEASLSQKAWMGGATLFFVTLVFPLQFSKEWITIGWALEGAALCWLFRRVPHRGLIVWGAGLLAVSFARLALNPAVVEYHQRAATPILNWYLYAYGVTALALFAAARLVPEDALPELQGIALPPALRGLGTVLAFLLVNIEIADYFSTGPTLTFRFSGSFAMDVAYSLAWGAFALVLLLVGIRSGDKTARLASLGLFAATIAKVFLHDLWRLGQLYRVGSIFVLAVLLILVSFLYQRFIAPDRGRSRGAGTGGGGARAQEEQE
jgi:uncharacterized membrane protein